MVVQIMIIIEKISLKNEKVGEMPTTIYSPYRQSKSNTTVLSIIICILGGGVGCSLFFCLEG